jgi:hypothetical protein
MFSFNKFSTLFTHYKLNKSNNLKQKQSNEVVLNQRSRVRICKLAIAQVSPDSTENRTELLIVQVQNVALIDITAYINQSKEFLHYHGK